LLLENGSATRGGYAISQQSNCGAFKADNYSSSSLIDIDVFKVVTLASKNLGGESDDIMKCFTRVKIQAVDLQSNMTFMKAVSAPAGTG
jgi:hypothetical protein